VFDVQGGRRRGGQTFTSPVPNSKVLSLLRAEGNGPLPEGSVCTPASELDGPEYTAFDGGSSFAFTEASLRGTCETQKELDETWARLTEGGKKGRGGWLKIATVSRGRSSPPPLGTMMSDPNRGVPRKMMEAC